MKKSSNWCIYSKNIGLFSLLGAVTLAALVLSTSFSAQANTKAESEAIPLQLYDVSILLPLPDSTHWNLLPQGATEGALGPLLPLDYFKKLPQILGLATNDKIYKFMRVVAIRIDPCFFEGVTLLACQPQLRFVWQPIAKNGEATSTFDATVHSFYNLSAADFEKLISEIRALKSQQPLLPSNNLSVHPILAQQGLQGDFSKNLFTTIFKYVGAKNLVRLTFMKLFLDGKVWEFGGFNLLASQSGSIEFSAIEIPRAKNLVQRFKNAATPEPLWFHGGIDPALPDSNDNLSFLVQDSREVSPQLQEREVTEAVRAAFRIENPLMHNPGTMDCVSCHVAQMARSWALRQYPWFNLSTTLKDAIYASNSDLRNLSPLQNQTNVLRAFGYFLESPVVSQRVINESAEVLRQVNQGIVR